jgi:hypothetical protein
MDKERAQAWRDWWAVVHGKNTPAGSYNPLEAHMHDAFVAGWDAASAHAEKEIIYLKEQLLRVGNQRRVIKEAYLAGQMAGRTPNEVFNQMYNGLSGD